MFHCGSNKDYRPSDGAATQLACSVLLLISCLKCCTPGAGATLEPLVLFELAYGEEDSQISISVGGPDMGDPMGPIGLAAGPSGDVYIADPLQGKVKRFGDDGRLLVATKGNLMNMSQPAIARDGKIWVRAGASIDELIEFNPDGSRVSSVKDEEGRVVEPRGGDYILSQIDEWLKSHGLHPHPELWSLDCDELGRVYVGVSGYTFEPGVSGARPRVFVFSPSMRLAAVMLGDFVSPDGYVHSVPGRVGENATETLTVYRADGVRERDLVVPEPASAADVLSWRGGENAGRWYYAADRAAIYIFDAIPRKNVGKEPYYLTEQLRVLCDLSVVKTDREGRLLTAFRLPRGPFSNCRPVFVHPGGDIYYLEFGPESLTVNMIPAQELEAAAKQNLTPEIPRLCVSPGSTRLLIVGLPS